MLAVRSVSTGAARVVDQCPGSEVAGLFGMGLQQPSQRL